MKKSLIALAALAAVGAASAQSSVTLFGVLDATWAHGSGSTSSKTQLTNSGYNSSRLGFRGTEDLGGGMSASFWLEAGVNNDSGAGSATNANNQAAAAALGNGQQGLTFNRRSTVSLAGGWGELRLGRDYSPQFWNLTVFDPYGYNGVGTTIIGYKGAFTGVTAVRVSNAVAYFLPGNLGGMYGQVSYYMGENNSNAGVPAGSTHKDGTGYGLRFGYAAGPVNVAVATSKTQYFTGDVKTTNIGGSYDFGVAKLMAIWEKDKVGVVTGKGWQLGGLIPVGPGDIRLSYGRYQDNRVASEPESKQLAVGYVHNLSKRTALYATYARVSNSGQTAATAPVQLNGGTGAINTRATGYDLGIRHSF